MNEQEGRQLASIAKWGEPREQWSQDRPNTWTNSFGVVDNIGKSIKGMSVELEVFISPRLGCEKFVFTLRQTELKLPQRAYQLEVNNKQGVKIGDHSASHEHFGEPRFISDQSWLNLSFDNAVKRFCQTTNLTLTEPLTHFQEFKLK